MLSLSEVSHPEKSVDVKSFPELREVLETDFRVDYEQTVLDRIQLKDDGLIEFHGRQYPAGQYFLESMAKTVGIPINYAYDCDYELFRHNITKRQESHSKAVTVCITRGIAVNLAGANYMPARTSDVVEKLQLRDCWQFRSGHAADSGVEISLIEPGCVTAPAPGDEIEFGVRITNSETGRTGLKASLFSHRLICTNGAVMADEFGTARWNYDSRVAYLTSIAKFEVDLFKLRSRHEEQGRLYGDSLRRNLLDTELVNTWRRVRASVPGEVADSVLGVDAEDRQNCQQAIRERPPGAAAEPTDHILWDVHNHITAAARRFDFAIRSRFERIGGSMLADQSLN